MFSYSLRRGCLLAYQMQKHPPMPTKNGGPRGHICCPRGQDTRAAQWPQPMTEEWIKKIYICTHTHTHTLVYTFERCSAIEGRKPAVCQGRDAPTGSALMEALQMGKVSPAWLRREPRRTMSIETGNGSFRGWGRGKGGHGQGRASTRSQSGVMRSWGTESSPTPHAPSSDT